MSQFDCSECGETLRIEKVKSHLHKCRSMSVNCMYCACEFFEDDFKDHTNCGEKVQGVIERTQSRDTHSSSASRTDVSSKDGVRRSHSRSSRSSQAFQVPTNPGYQNMSPSLSPPDQITKYSEDEGRSRSVSGRKHGDKQRKRRRSEDESNFNDGRERRKRRRRRRKNSRRKTATSKRFKRFFKRLTADGPVSLTKLQDAFEHKFNNHSELYDFSKIIVVNEVMSSPWSETSESESESNGCDEECSSEQHVAQELKPCFNYEKGNCRFGTKCRYLHTSYGRAFEGGGEGFMDDGVVGYNDSLATKFVSYGESVAGGTTAPNLMRQKPVCISFQNGHCALGDNCQFVHDVSTQINSYWELQKGAGGQNFKNNQKSKPCFKFQSGFCVFGDRCRYLHDNSAGYTLPTNGLGELKGIGQGSGLRGTTKKKPCFNFNRGQCKFGEKCRYLHPKG